MDKPTLADLASVVKSAREAMRDSFWQPVLKRQAATTKDREVRDSCWVSRLLSQSPPESDACQLLLATVEYLGTGAENYSAPAPVDVPVHWVGQRRGVDKNAPEPKLSEVQKFEALNGKVECPLTIMYTYGGAHYINGPITRRQTATTLATLTKSRCVIVQHRLAPQNPFPCASLDVLHAYLSLLYPAPGSPNKAISPSQLVLAGDSSGCALAMSLLQTILATHDPDFPFLSTKRSIAFHGHEVPLPLPLPAGLTLQSPGLDLKGDCLDSWHANAEWDIFPDGVPSLDPRFPADTAWPTTPPRGNLYADSSCLGHPLVSPMTARSWAGAPPIYLAVGSRERSVDAARFVAQSAAQAGVSVVWDEYEYLPHNWPMILRGWPHSKTCYERWAEACLSFARGDNVRSSGSFTDFDGLQCREVDVLQLTPYTLGKVLDQVGERVKALDIFMASRAAGRSVL